MSESLGDTQLLLLAKTEMALLKQQISDYQTNLELNKHSLKMIIESAAKGDMMLKKALNNLTQENVNLQNSLFREHNNVPRLIRDVSFVKKDDKACLA